MIDNVIAVPASGTCAQVGRTIDVTYAQRGKIGHQSRGVGEGELAVELQAIGRAREAGGDSGSCRGPPWTQAAQRFRELDEPRVVRPLLQGERQLAPPVRMGVDGRRKIGLLANADDVFELNRQHLRRCAGKEGLHR